jgi:DNA-binding transcriptional ArsR family regulator
MESKHAPPFAAIGINELAILTPAQLRVLGILVQRAIPIGDRHNGWLKTDQAAYTTCSWATLGEDIGMNRDAVRIHAGKLKRANLLDIERFTDGSIGVNYENIYYHKRPRTFFEMTAINKNHWTRLYLAEICDRRLDTRLLNTLLAVRYSCDGPEAKGKTNRTSKDISKITGEHKRTVRRHLDDLLRMGRIYLDGDGNTLVTDPHKLYTETVLYTDYDKLFAHSRTATDLSQLRSFGWGHALYNALESTIIVSARLTRAVAGRAIVERSSASVDDVRLSATRFIS